PQAHECVCLIRVWIVARANRLGAGSAPLPVLEESIQPALADPPRRRLVPEAGGNEPAVNCTLALERAVHREPAPVRLRRLQFVAAPDRTAGGDVLRRGGDLSLRLDHPREGADAGGVARDAVVAQDLSLDGDASVGDDVVELGHDFLSFESPGRCLGAGCGGGLRDRLHPLSTSRRRAQAPGATKSTGAVGWRPPGRTPALRPPGRSTRPRRPAWAPAPRPTSPRPQQRVDAVRVRLPAAAPGRLDQSRQALGRAHDLVALHLDPHRVLVAVVSADTATEAPDDVPALRGQPVGAAVPDEVPQARERAHAVGMRLVALIRGHPPVGAGRVENRLGGLVCAVDSVEDHRCLPGRAPHLSPLSTARRRWQGVTVTFSGYLSARSGLRPPPMERPLPGGRSVFPCPPGRGPIEAHWPTTGTHLGEPPALFACESLDRSELLPVVAALPFSATPAGAALSAERRDAYPSGIQDPIHQVPVGRVNGQPPGAQVSEDVIAGPPAERRAGARCGMAVLQVSHLPHPALIGAYPGDVAIPEPLRSLGEPALQRS